MTQRPLVLGVCLGLAAPIVYHEIVKRIARKNFLRVNEKDYEALLKDCAPNIRHKFGGNHALGGERHDRASLRRWFERLGRLGPTLKLTVRNVWVSGWPNDTTVVIRWTATQDLPDSVKPAASLAASAAVARRAFDAPM